MKQTPDRHVPHPARRWLLLLFKVVVSVGLLWYLLSRVDLERLWLYASRASLAWLVTGVALYVLMLVISAWRWQVLLAAQAIPVPASRLVNSYLVATFFNNFLPSNIGGDVIRVRDTAAAAGSKTLATTVVLMDRGIGLLGLFLVAAVGATSAPAAGKAMRLLAPTLWLGLFAGVAVAVPLVLMPHGIAWLLSPLRRIHQEWVGERITRFTAGLGRFGRAPQALLSCFLGAIAVQAVLVGFYAAIARSMGIPVSGWHLAVIVPVSFIVQMAPVSVNGLGVREATFTFYFSQLGLPPESALAVSFVGAVLVMLVSLSGAVAYVLRGSSQAWKPVLPADADS